LKVHFTKNINNIFEEELKLTVKNDKNNIGISKENLDNLKEMLKFIKFGSVTLVIQDGVVVQIEKNEKVRIV
jgi:hypothetical protein